MKYLIVLLSAFLLISCSTLVQHGKKIYEPTAEEGLKDGYNIYQKDFLHLAVLCEEGFPLIDSYFPAEERLELKKEIISRLGQPGTDEKIFTVLCRKYMARFHNQHTSVYTSVSFEQEFPFTLFNHEDDWYLLSIGDRDYKNMTGEKIVAVNHQAVDHFINKVGEFVFAENEIGKRKAVVRESLYNKSEFLALADIIPQPDSLLLEVEGHTPFWIKRTKREASLHLQGSSPVFHPVTGQNGRAYNYELFPDKKMAYLRVNRFHDQDDMLSAVDSYVRPHFQPLARLYLRHQFKKNEPDTELLYRYDPLRPSFKGYLWSMMQEMDSLRLDHLVIDLRNNPGGNLMLCRQLLYFLSKKRELNDFNRYIYTSEVTRFFQPRQYGQFKNRYVTSHRKPLPERQLFPLNQYPAEEDIFRRIRDPKSPYYISDNRPVFNGQVYVLADWTSQSAAALLATLLQDNGLGTVIGTSVANNPTGPTAHTPFVLPHTKATGSIASTYLSRPDSSKQEVFQPDYWVEPGVQDIISGRDPAWEKALELIGKESVTLQNRRTQSVTSE